MLASDYGLTIKYSRILIYSNFITLYSKSLRKILFTQVTFFITLNAIHEIYLHLIFNDYLPYRIYLRPSKIKKMYLVLLPGQFFAKL